MLSSQEVSRLLAVARNIKHQLALSVLPWMKQLVGFAAVAAVHVGCPNRRFQPDSSHPEYIGS